MKRITFILCVLFATLCADAKTTVEATIDSIQIFVGQQTHVTLRVTSDFKDKVQFPPFKPNTLVLPNVELLEISAIDTAEQDGKRVLSQIYTFTSFDANLYSLPPLPVKVNGKEFKSDPLALKVLTIDVDTTNLDKFFPIKDIQNNPFSISDWIPVGKLYLLIALLLGVLVLLYVGIKNKKRIFVRRRLVKFIPAHTKALQELEELKKDSAPHTDSPEDTKEYYTRLTDTLRKYLKERFGFDAMEMTSGEIINHLMMAPFASEQDREEAMRELKMLFETADLVKFAKYTTQLNENDMNIVNAMEFVNTTKTEEIVKEEVVAEELSSDDRMTNILHHAFRIAGIVVIVGAVVALGFFIYKIIDLLT